MQSEEEETNRTPHLVHPSGRLGQGFHPGQAVPSPLKDQEGQDDQCHLKQGQNTSAQSKLQ